MEAQLQQSIPKKAHQEVVAKMQTTIDGLVAELERTKADLQKTNHLEERITSLSEQITSQTDAITSQWRSNETKRIAELEERIGQMVDKTELVSLQSKYDELKTTTVPKEDYSALQNQFSNYVPREVFEEMQKSFAQTTVPREQLVAAQARVQELETKIANSIPLSEHEEVITKLTSLIGEVPTSDAQATEIAPPELLVTSSR
jgi:chromosome segregation ATPase